MNLLLKYTSFLTLMIHSVSLSALAQDWKAPAFSDTIRSSLKTDVKILSEGKKLYENMCWSCHGLSGKGDGPAAAAINPRPADHTSGRVQQQKDGNIYWKISTGNGVMQPYGKTLTSKQRWALVSYIRQLADSAIISTDHNP